MTKYNSNNKDKLQLLLDYRLGMVSTTEASEIEQLLKRDNQLRQLDNAIIRTLKPLQSLEDVLPPANLAQKTMLRIAKYRQTQETALNLPHTPTQIIQKQRTLTANKNKTNILLQDFRRHESRLGWVLGNFRDLFAVAASIMLVFLLVQPGLYHARQYARRVKCASNMHKIGIAMAQYNQDNQGLMPQVKRQPGTFWLKVPGKNNKNMPNSRNMYLLVKNGYITPDVFFCPGREPSNCTTTDSRTPYHLSNNQLRAMDNFPSDWPIGYSLRMLPNNQPRLNNNNSNNTVLVADKNPVFVRFDPRHPDELDLAEQPSLLNRNSYNHNNQGQNVLLGNGSVFFSPTRHWGPSLDDIYTIKHLKRYHFNEIPQPDDIFAP